MGILRKYRKSNKKFGFKKFIILLFSLVMTTFAWFAYSKILNTYLNLHIAAWDMEYYINDEKKENPIGIDFPILYPQMEEQTVRIDIKNNGEALVDIDYHIESITLAGVTYELVPEGEQNTTENFVNITVPVITQDPETGEMLAKGYIINDLEKFPFTIEVEHSLQVLPNNSGYLTVKANWIGDNDELDSEWGYKVGKYFIDNPDATSAVNISLSIDSYQADAEIQSGAGSLPSTVATRPYLPTSDYSKLDGTDLDTGLVIKDSLGNEYVWIEVPKLASTYPTAGINIKEFTDEEYTKIENDLQAYTATYRSGAITSDQYYSDEATGLTSTAYSELKKKMLKSVYQNGGFYIGRYEAGIATVRKNHTSVAGLVPQSQANLYPFNYVTCSEAQALANRVPSGEKTSSLMFGIQWNLVQKFIESKAVAQGTNISTIQSLLKTNSTSWGNYESTKYEITDGNVKYSTNNGSTWFNAPYNKTSSGKTLLTAGAIGTFGKQNVFDLAGNVWEWTLEYSSNTSNPCTIRGGAYESTSSENNTNTVSNGYPSFSYFSIGFRVSIY